MGSISFWHWAIIIFIWLLPMFPIAEVLRKAGYNRAWALLWLVPYANIIAFLVFAYAKWPILKK